MPNDLYEKIVSERGSLENLAGKIPGLQGYMEMSARREADRMIRDYVAGKYRPLSERLASIEREMLSGGGLTYLDRTKSIKTKIDNLQRRISTDMPGYSGFFASVKIGADELAKVYAFDEAMIRYTDQISEKLDALSKAVSSSEGIAEALSALDATVIEAGQAYDLRDDLLKGIA
jgi:hypothetical protein